MVNEAHEPTPTEHFSATDESPESTPIAQPEASDAATEVAADETAPEVTGGEADGVAGVEPAAEASEPDAEPAVEVSESAAEPTAVDVEPAVEAAVAEPAPIDPIFEPIPTDLGPTALIFRAPPPPVFAPEPVAAEPLDEPGAARRRTRGRSGASAEAGEQVQTTRTRRVVEAELITEPQRVRGSTRLEAKKMRRREGRDQNRRRVVVTEAEFLARRESVDRTMVVREKHGRVQIGVLEDGVLVEHYIARNQEASLIGNVYLGKVQNVLPSMEAAFVDIGRGRNAVLYSGEVDWDAAAEAGEKNQPRRIELALKSGDTVLVQVTKDPVGHKGARLTSQISLPGRYLVYVPNGSMNGISRKLPDTERVRLKRILKEVLPENQGVIVRTAAEGATEEQLTVDVTRLLSQWTHLSETMAKVQAPALLHAEPDLLIKIVRDVFNEDFQAMVIDGKDSYDTITTYVSQVAPDLLERISAYEGDRDAFDQFRITEQIDKALERKVWLPSGGSLIVDRTEAMTVIDVNTGKFVGSGGNLEETVTRNNLEAAEEIVRQLRLRDIGGIVVIDFIDMVLESNRDLVLRRLVECLSRDRTKHQVAEVTSLGLVQMTRKKLGLGLLESYSESCEVCLGRGIIVHHEPVTRARTQQQPVERRRSKGGQAPAAEAPRQTAPTANHGGTHGITEGAKLGLALVAAKTIPHADVKEPTSGESSDASGGASDDQSAEAQAPAGQSSSRRRRGRGRRVSTGRQSAPASE
ncbi:MAG TPA: Rne/Rng family ribonuclease [Candidatus Lumbricidophila sp.]|nr:Rne/Rng family ribonuclease [Candidatus Lumbricidophila sp.]